MGLSRLQVMAGGLNLEKADVLNNVRIAIRRQLPQVRPYQIQPASISILGGGPSLSSRETELELRDRIFNGSHVAVTNGAYQWAIDRNIRPNIAIALDARKGNADFFKTPVPNCKYLIASQCDPEMFDMLEGREVYLWHALSNFEEESAILDGFYGPQHYFAVTGGSTVMLRAISLLRMLGFIRMDIFGMDSCWMDERHHAYPQALNDNESRRRVLATPEGGEGRWFEVAGWHLKQANDFEQLIKERGNLFDLQIHGDGLIAYLVREGARIQREKPDESREHASADAAPTHVATEGHDRNSGAHEAEDSRGSDIVEGSRDGSQDRRA